MKVRFGIYIGTSSASIAKMEAGEVLIYRSDTQRDYIPLCVLVTKKGLIVGDKAHSQLPKDKKKAFTDQAFQTNVFIEFTRTLGSDIRFSSSNANRSFSSEELLAEVIKALRLFVNDENVEAAVITVPASFEMNQINAVRKAGFLAGLKQIEIITEEYAAALFYGLDSKKNTGYSLIYKLTGSSFSCSLIKSEDGIIRLIDSDGNQFFGNRIFDEAIVENVFIPFLKNNYSIDSILEDAEKLNAFIEIWKPLAEDVKNQLSYKDEYLILTNHYDEYGEDDEGEEFEIDLTISRDELKEVIAPFIQQTIDFCDNLLKRNNLTGASLNDIILVGKHTLSPIVREMLEEQIKKPNTSFDYENAIVKGAAIYASRIDLETELLKYSLSKNNQIKQTMNIELINEKYDREYLQLYKNGEMTLLEVKESLEEANRKNGIVYKEVLALISKENKSITKVKVEELLFQITEEGLIPATTFQDFYEQLSNINDDSHLLEKLYKNIKAYESK